MENSIKIENNEVVVFKDCKLCKKISVCKFHSQMKKLCNSNEFYEMQQYLEWNNSLEAFERYASCRFYEKDITINEDGSFVKLNSIIREQIVRDYYIKNQLKHVSYSDTHLKHKVDGEVKIIDIDNIIKEYKLKNDHTS